MSKTGLKALLGTSLAISGLISWQLAGQFYIDYIVDDNLAAVKVYSQTFAMAIVFGVLSFITFIWAAISAYYRE
jgi:hypothetical protein